MFYYLNIIHTEQVTCDIFFGCRNKDNDVMIDGENFFDLPGGTNLRTNDSIRKIETG